MTLQCIFAGVESQLPCHLYGSGSEGSESIYLGCCAFIVYTKMAPIFHWRIFHFTWCTKFTKWILCLMSQKFPKPVFLAKWHAPLNRNRYTYSVVANSQLLCGGGERQQPLQNHIRYIFPVSQEHRHLQTITTYKVESIPSHHYELHVLFLDSIWFFVFSFLQHLALALLLLNLYLKNDLN